MRYPQASLPVVLMLGSLAAFSLHAEPEPVEKTSWKRKGREDHKV